MSPPIPPQQDIENLLEYLGGRTYYAYKIGHYRKVAKELDIYRDLLPVFRGCVRSINRQVPKQVEAR